jgi:hypothetical protein
MFAFPLFLIIANLLTSPATIIPVSVSNSQKEDLMGHLNQRVVEMIAHADDVPGLQCGTFNHLKNGVAEKWDTLIKQGALEAQGTDRELRPYFVALRGIVEDALSREFNKNITSFVGIISTPMPTTPLCTKGEVSHEVIHPDNASNTLKNFSIKTRNTIFRDYLHQGGVLYIVYPQNGLNQRMDSQQKIYKTELQNYPKNLFDSPCQDDSLNPSLIGATYLFQDTNKNVYAFAVNMTEVSNPQDHSTFRFWLGSIDNAAIQQHLKQICPYVSKNQSAAFNTLLNGAH